MQRITRAVFISCFSITISAYSHPAAAQAEQGAPRPATSSFKQERGWKRFGVGIKSGLSLSLFIGKDSGSEIAEFTNKPDIMFGISGVVKLQRWLSLQPELLLISKGRQVEVDGTLSDTLDVDYFEFPLLARISIPVGEQVAPYLFAGPAIGVLRRFQIKSENDGSITDRTDEAKSIDFSGIAGAGIEIALTQQHALMLEGRYDRSFQGFLDDDSVDVKNRAFAFILGYQYSFASAAPSRVPQRPHPDEPERLDSDDDGTGDQDDQCPYQAEDKDGFADEDGCPEPDNDGDRVPDETDECPNTPGTPELNGCLDGDSDSVADHIDECPDTPGNLALNGCPDGDDDSVPDHLDICPNTAGKPEVQGCNLVRISDGKIELLGEVGFRRNSARLQPDSYTLLDEVTDILTAHPELTKVRISVHMTVRKESQASRRLAQKRAEAVKEYLTRKNVASDRLNAVSNVEEDRNRRRGEEELRMEIAIVGDDANDNASP